MLYLHILNLLLNHGLPLPIQDGLTCKDYINKSFYLSIIQIVITEVTEESL